MKKQILVIGAGRSSKVLIDYLLDHAEYNNWFVTLADYEEKNAINLIRSSKYGKAIFFDVNNNDMRFSEINKSDIVVSMLPASLHILVAKDCLALSKDMVTASYISNDLYSLKSQIESKNILFLNEIGLDPGIDHMSAMKVIDEIKKNGGELISFKSFCGGLIHPENDNNPWNYKFTWNPRNVVLAGKGTAKYLNNNVYKNISYNRVFEDVSHVSILNEGDFEAYPNRDSLKYIDIYGLQGIETMIRGTLRRKGFCSSWDIFVKLGMTDDSNIIKNNDNMTYSDYINYFLPDNDSFSIEEKFCTYLNISRDSEQFRKMEWLGLFSNNKIILDEFTSADLLQYILEEKFTLEVNDKDMVVMQHQFRYKINGIELERHSSLIVYGDDQNQTAMAKTVGLPLAIAVKLILNGDINVKGLCIPISKDIYKNILIELEQYGIAFKEEFISH